MMKRHAAFKRTQKALLSEGLKRAVMNVYPLPDLPDQYHALGRLFELFSMYKEAMLCFQSSLMTMGDNPKVHYDIGLCFLSLLNTSAAIEAFEYVLELEPENKDAKRWLERLKDAEASSGVLKLG